MFLQIANHFLAVYCLLLLFLAFIISLLRNKYNALARIPGPAMAAYSRLWRVYNVAKGQAHQTAIALHRKHGKLVRIAPNVVSIGDVDEIAKIYNIKGEYTKTAFYPLHSIAWEGQLRTNLFSVLDENEHRDRKRKVANAYAVDSLLKMEPAINDCSRLLTSKLDEFVDREEPVDFGNWLHYYAFDVIGEISFEKRFGFLESGSDVDGIIASISSILQYSAICGQLPEAHNYLLANPLLPMIFPEMENWNQIVVFTLKAINNRTNLNKNGELELNDARESHDMLTRWAAVKSRDPLKMTTRDIMVNLSANVFAGADTTAIALRAVFYYLVKNVDKMQKLVDEILAADCAGQLSDPVSEKEARALPYLNAVLKEAMRMHPSVGLLLERHVPVAGATICGHFMPGGTIVGINPWVMHYDRDIFEDPEAFRPERWMDSDAERLSAMEKAFFNFGAGSRYCLGSHISMIEMRKVVPQLLRYYEIEFEGGIHQEWAVKDVWLIQQKMPLCRLRRRSQI